MDQFDVKSVRQLIDTAFGNYSNCPIDFNIVGSVLYILARELDVLKREIRVQARDKLRLLNLSSASSSRYAVREIKIHTKEKRRDQQQTKSSRGLSSKVYFYILPPEQFASTDKSSSKKRHSEKLEQHSSQRRPGKSVLRSSFMEMFVTDEYFNKKPGSLCYGYGGKDPGAMSPEEQRRPGRYGGISSVSRSEITYDGKINRFNRHGTGKHDGEFSPSERRRGGKHDVEMSSSQRRVAEKYDDETSLSARRTSRKYDDERRSNESVLIGKSKSKKYRERKTGAGGSREKGGKYGALDFENDEDLEERHEKIYIVTRTTPGGQISQPESDLQPVVTQEQFKELVEEVRALQMKFGITDILPDDFNDLRQPTSMTHPRTALNLSARLDTAESRLAQMMDIFTQLASQVPGIDLEAAFDEKFYPTDGNKDFERIDQAPLLSETAAAISHDTRTETHRSSRDNAFYSQYVSEENDETESVNGITFAQLNFAMQKVYDDLKVHFNKATDRTLKSIRSLGDDLTGIEVQICKYNKTLEDLLNLHDVIDKFGGKVMDIDQRMTAQVTLYQDNLTEMQIDLEDILEKLYEALASPQEDPAAVEQTTESFKNFQMDLTSTTYKQLELQKEIEHSSKSLKDIVDKIELLRTVKSTRDQMVEALSEKLSIKDVNGFLAQQQFVVINAQLIKMILNMNHKLYSMEWDWQNAIDDLYETERTSADIIQVESLAESIQLTFKMLNENVNYMFDIAGPSLAPLYPTKKILDREGNCLSCGTPAKLESSETDIALWKEMLAKDTAIQSNQQIGEKEAIRVCIPGQPIPHPLEQNPFVCEHDCGDSVNTNNMFEFLITELKPAQAASVEMQKGTRVDIDSHKEWCLCEKCSYLEKMHAAIK